MAGSTAEVYMDSELGSGGISRVNALATRAILIGHHRLFHSSGDDYNRSIGRRKEGGDETKALTLRVKNRDTINTNENI